MQHPPDTVVPYQPTSTPHAVTVIAVTPSGRQFLAAVWAKGPREARALVDAALHKTTHEIGSKIMLTTISFVDPKHGKFLCPAVDVTAAKLLVEHEPPTSTTALLLEIEEQHARTAGR